MNVKMALLFCQAEQQAALPSEQRQLKLEDVCKVAGVQVGQYEVGPYLDEINIIAERKKNATTGSSSANTQNEVTPDPALPLA